MLDLTLISDKRSTDLPGADFTLWLTLLWSTCKAKDFLGMHNTYTQGEATFTGNKGSFRDRWVHGRVGSPACRSMLCFQSLTASNRATSADLQQKQAKEKT